jgi:predicted RNase H-like HicB family nuclease
LLLEEYLAVPYLLTAYSAVGDDGRWHRYVEYEELGCVAEGEHVIEAIDRLEEMRVTLIAERYARGEEIPVPRPPLRSVQRAIEARGLPAAARLDTPAPGSRG